MEFKYSCLIVDDEYPAHEVIKYFINLNPKLSFVKSCYNGEDALNEITNKNYDIVFLDINMPILSGIEVLKKLNLKPAIIITTAYTNFAFDAYQHDANDYVQKPIPLERFEKAIDKAIGYVDKRKLENSNIVNLKVDGINRKINQLEIIYCQSMGNYTKLYLQENSKPIIVNRTLVKHLEILNPSLFIQIHRTCIVNKSFIIRKKECLLVLKNDVELPIGRKFIPSINSLNL